MSNKPSKEKRKFERFRLEDLEHVTISFSDLDVERPIFNLSYKGLGFRPQKEDAKKLPVGLEIPASLKLNDFDIPIRVEILYQTPEVVGAKITPTEDADIRKIIRFISPLRSRSESTASSTGTHPTASRTPKNDLVCGKK